MRPLIGISMCFDDRGRLHAKRESQYLDCAYARAVEHCGGVAILLPMQQDAPALAEQIDGLLLPGGGDFVPAAPYPDDVHFDPLPPALGDFDRTLLARARERGLPFLGICYGMQLLALERGGCLHYDIPTDLPGAGAHGLPEPEGRHPLEIVPGTRLAALLGDAPESVNSRHHQAVAEPGDGLRVCARADDGVIEAIEDEGPDFCVGVQWHPEGLDGPHRDALFGAFVDAARLRRRGERGAG
jgi:putative glutamine amidotransferase